MPKCKSCGKQIQKDKGFLVKVGKSNTYYCSEEEYQNMQKNKEQRDKTHELIWLILGHKINSPTFISEINKIATIYPYSIILAYLKAEKQHLEYIVQNKDFSCEYGMVRYFSVVLENGLKGFKVKKSEKITPVDFEFASSNYRQGSKRRGLYHLDSDEE